jgi:predicted RNase H-like HicB family nuclease
MITEYIAKAMARAEVKQLEDGTYFASVPGLQGPWGNGSTKEECLGELREVLEEWLVASLRDDDELPEIEGVSLNFGGKRWSGQLRAASSSKN